MSSLEFSLRKIDETRRYLLDELKYDSINDKYQKPCMYINYGEHLLILVSTVNGCVLDSAFASLVCIANAVTSSSVGKGICAITAGI